MGPTLTPGGGPGLEWAMVRISRQLTIPDEEVELTAIRASGPGGQHVNKVSSAVQLRFDIGASSLPEGVKQQLRTLPDRRISAEGVLTIKAQRFREQGRNRADALERLVTLVRRALYRPPERVPTRPSARARRKRVEEKVRRGQVKVLRGRVRPDGDG